jgi:hypothetical protein
VSPWGEMGTKSEQQQTSQTPQALFHAEITNQQGRLHQWLSKKWAGSLKIGIPEPTIDHWASQNYT